MDYKKILLIIIIILILVVGAVSLIFNSNEQTIKNWNDTAISTDHNDIWKTSNSVIMRESDGTLITRGDNESWFYLYLNPSGTGSNFIHAAPFTLEFDIINETSRSQIEFRDNNTVSYFEFNSLPNRGLGHWKIDFNSTVQKYYHDEELVKTDNQIFSDGIRIGFVGIYNNNSTNNSTLKFMNFKMY